MNESVGWVRRVGMAWLSGILLICGCMHKDMAHCEADDVIKAVVCSGPQGDILVAHESIFQAISKSSGRGLTRIYGYNETRLSAYGIDDGRLLARIEFGQQKGNPIGFLGVSGGRLWFYSLDPGLGLHGRDPRTLAVTVSQKQILAAAPALQNNLAKIKWFQINDFFAYDELHDRLIVTDMQGFRWAVDPRDFAVSKMSAEVSFSNIRQALDPCSNGADFRSANLYLSNDLRGTISWKNAALDPRLSYLEGKFLCDTNKQRMLQKLDREFQQSKARQGRLTAQMAAMNKGGVAGHNDLSAVRTALRETENGLAAMEIWRREISEEGLFMGYNPLLQPDEDSFYVIHRGSVAPDARMRLSRLHFPEGGPLQERWQTEIPKIFFDVDKARETDDFKTVFSRGNPNLRFQFFEQVKNKLVFIRMLHAVCVDGDTGRVLWQKRL